MVWLLNDGTCDFWYDNWLGSGPLFLRASVVPGLSFSDVMVNGTWDNCRLSQILPPTIVDEVMYSPALSGRVRPSDLEIDAIRALHFGISLSGGLPRSQQVTGVLSHMAC